MIFGAAYSCTGDTVDPECSEEEHKSISFESISTSSLAFKGRDVPFEQRDKSEVNLIIKSEKDFNKYLISRNGFPGIDFSKNVLLCGRKTYMHCVRLDSVNVVEMCNKIQHRVYIREGICGAITDIYYFTLVPVNYSKKKIDFVNTEIKAEDLINPK